MKVSNVHSSVVSVLMVVSARYVLTSMNSLAELQWTLNIKTGLNRKRFNSVIKCFVFYNSIVIVYNLIVLVYYIIMN